MTASDTYTRRLTSEFSLVNRLQFDLFVEELWRFNHEVSYCESDLEPTDTANVEGLITRLEEIYGYGIRNYQNEKLAGWSCISPFKDTALFLGKGRYGTGEFPSNLTMAMMPGAYDWEKVSELCKTYGISIGKIPTDKDKVAFSFAMPSDMGIREFNRSFPRISLDDIQMNYSTKVIQQTRQVIERLRVEKSGLVVLNGPPGTGKSYLIKAILSELDKERYGVVCTPPSHFLTNMTHLTEAATLAEGDDWSPHVRRKPKSSSTLIIMEDIGEMLMETNVVAHVNESSNLLNFTDGMMSTLADSIFLVSFNHDIGKINPALLRPGRCIAQITVNELSYPHARKLVREEIALPEKTYSLAEVYAINSNGEVLETFGSVSSAFGLSRR